MSNLKQIRIQSFPFICSCPFLWSLYVDKLLSISLCSKPLRAEHPTTQIPYFIFIVNNPCCPNNISLMKLNNPSHTTGVISTPNAGGTDPLTNRSKGSVGQTIRLNGTSFKLAVGYQERTMRHNCRDNKQQEFMMRKTKKKIRSR